MVSNMLPYRIIRLYTGIFLRWPFMTICTNLPPPRSDKKVQILDAAERLFARFGYDGVTLRTIATEAGVDVALTSYYFGPKADLFDAVVARRGTVLNDARLNALRAAQAEYAPEPAPIERVVEAFLRPLAIAQESQDPGWRSYCALIAYINNSPALGKATMEKHFDHLVQQFIQALQLLYPDAPAVGIYWCYHYLSGALALTFADTGRIDSLSKGMCHSHDFTAAYNNMIPFVAAGFNAVCNAK